MKSPAKSYIFRSKGDILKSRSQRASDQASHGKGAQRLAWSPRQLGDGSNALSRSSSDLAGKTFYVRWDAVAAMNLSIGTSLMRSFAILVPIDTISTKQTLALKKKRKQSFACKSTKTNAQDKGMHLACYMRNAARRCRECGSWEIVEKSNEHHPWTSVGWSTPRAG